MAGTDDFARARQLAVDAADPRTPAVLQSELRELALIHAVLALTEAITNAAPREAP